MAQQFCYTREMDVVLDIASSVEFWRKTYPLNRAPKVDMSVSPTNCAYLQADIKKCVSDQDISILAYYGTLHVLVFDPSKRLQTGFRETHLWGGRVPEGGFYQYKEHIFVESPEFMFLHAASLLEIEDLIAFGDELCGLYSFDDREQRGFRIRKEPLTTIEKLSDYLSRAKGCYGAKNASRALRYVIERSASPMETFDEMAICLPCKLGGYGMWKPMMNEEVPLTERAARIARRQKCYLDMGYLKFGLDIEHHGRLDHSSDEDRASDRARVNGLKEMGIEVIELTKDQVEDLFAFEFIVERIARILGKRIRKECKGATQARLKLRKSVKRWNGSSGRIR